jgi:hypothetical protein
MKLFKRNYTIVADKEANFIVQKFACQHAVTGSQINITVDDEDNNIIRFTSWDKRDGLIQKIIRYFEQCFEVKVEKELIFITTKKGESK